MSIDYRELCEQVKVNSDTLRECNRHHFPRQDSYRLGEKLTCSACGGSLDLTKIGQYIQGYEAAGGQADDILPGYREARQ